MEKLQAALEKARHQRRGGKRADQPAAAPTARGGHKAKFWSDLKEIAISEEILQHHNIVSRKASLKATPFDILRTKVLLQMQQNGWTSLAITSPMPRSGKTTTACNLALGLGRQSGLRTILFDFDLQSPSVSDYLGYRPDIDVSEVLSGQANFADQAVRIGDNVAVSMSNRTETDPTSILLSDETRDALQNIQDTYAPDITIFDTSSILVGDNTRAFLKNVDCALIVARAESTRYTHFDACEREIAEYTNVLGVVLNAFKTKKLEDSIE